MAWLLPINLRFRIYELRVLGTQNRRYWEQLVNLSLSNNLTTEQFNNK